jgi:hypothetical protein
MVGDHGEDPEGAGLHAHLPCCLRNGSDYTRHARLKFVLRHCYSAMLAFLRSITLGHRLACQSWP